MFRSLILSDNWLLIAIVEIVALCLDVTYVTGQRLVDRLVREGILTALDDRAYGKTFVAHQILAVLHVNAPEEL